MEEAPNNSAESKQERNPFETFNVIDFQRDIDPLIEKLKKLKDDEIENLFMGLSTETRGQLERVVDIINRQ